ncbi:hypothetical protein EPUS_05331 [Endocarpon pusillum Z07020]|uniref:Chromo domain-containing protein n=1 Tax=Endocarpon pusillum (strain Z07020 / HMAS-L-300199) TaxID=1263415 RepID=U1HQC3_ENDPU|nr:uncharacterized protein EPUS_05331 [Endocarpon pusillum Z07020]ERF71279.1 hypothetical protein EPUS_05331 [Endocarpon pusillum Z07020]
MPEAPEQLVQERKAARDIAAEGLQITAEARLRLSPKSYSLPSTRKFALSPRYTRAFRILEAVSKGNALRINLPAAWKMHQVISKIHLDPAPNPDDDPYQRNLPPPPDHIDEQGMEQWKVEKIVSKLVDDEAILYKVRWEGYNEEDDTWEDSAALEHAQEVVGAYEEALERSRLRGRRQAGGATLYREPRGRPQR